MNIQINSPFQTKSGYGYRSKDFIEQFIKNYGNIHNIKLKSLIWGASEKHKTEHLDKYIINKDLDNIDIFIHIGLPNECMPIGDYNVLITAGIECDKIKNEWILGANRMDLVLVSSEHSKQVFIDCGVETEIKTLFEGIPDIFYNQEYERTELSDKLDDIDFGYLFIGQWLPGDVGQDRKDIGMLIKTFSDTFESHDKKPTLILKTNMINYSEYDYYTVKKRIKGLKQNGIDVRLIHGNLTLNQIVELYNHKAIKSFISFTKGEGWGRDLAQFGTTGKPIICSDYGGHLDFIKHALFLFGELKNIHSSTNMQQFTTHDANWFNVNYDMAKTTIIDLYNNYENYKDIGIQQKEFITIFTMNKFNDKITEIFNSIIK